MSAHSFSERGKCPPLFFLGGANVLPLVLGRGKCPWGNCLGEMSGGKCPTLVKNTAVFTVMFNYSNFPS